MTATPRLLIVDDERDTCANLADIFADLGYEVDVAYEGESALALVRKKTYDVALLDLKMPGMDGLELYRRIKKISSGTVAIVVTAYASTETAASILAAGAAQILSKPVDFAKLSQAVEDALDQPLLLIVDDDEDLCDSLWDLFHERHYRVSLAHDVPAAEAQIREHEYNIVIADMKLPNGSGKDIVALARHKHGDARTIVITGHRLETSDEVERTLADGAAAVCYKPFDVKQLLATVRGLVKR